MKTKQQILEEKLRRLVREELGKNSNLLTENKNIHSGSKFKYTNSKGTEFDITVVDIFFNSMSGDVDIKLKFLDPDSGKENDSTYSFDKFRKEIYPKIK